MPPDATPKGGPVAPRTDCARPQARLYRDVKKVISLLKREDYTAVWIRPEEVARSRLRDREKVRGVCAVDAPFY